MLLPSARLTLLRLSLATAIADACDNSQSIAQRTASRRDIDKFWQQMVREIRAIEGLNELHKLLSQVKPRTTASDYQTARPNDYMPGWRG